MIVLRQHAYFMSFCVPDCHMIKHFIKKKVYYCSNFIFVSTFFKALYCKFLIKPEDLHSA